MHQQEADFSYRLWRHDGAQGELIPLLQSAQEHFGYIPRRAIRYISGVTKVPESKIYGVITFYSQFRLQPMGKHAIRLCTGTACHVANASMLLDVIEDEIGTEVDGTSEDGVFTLFSVACIGCCSLAPVMMVDDETHGSLTPVTTRRIVRKVRRTTLAGEKAAAKKAEEEAAAPSAG
ncbi:MAG: NAD(P)H-dependent oxidoreductase subunit E [Thermoanaerobaculales bacterium]|nr:NAD(P)H-dependent oxidoreductase subunit E [Thermoanaerobaculales bacterium]